MFESDFFSGLYLVKRFFFSHLVKLIYCPVRIATLFVWFDPMIQKWWRMEKIVWLFIYECVCVFIYRYDDHHCYQMMSFLLLTPKVVWFQFSFHWKFSLWYNSMAMNDVWTKSKSDFIHEICVAVIYNYTTNTKNDCQKNCLKEWK